MFDTVIRGGLVVDGTGQPAFEGDVGIVDGKISAVGGKLGAGKLEIDANGALVTPGWVDVHTHFDGQATWDPYLSPSTDHGVTSVVMGNCGVGFAPVKPDKREWLIGVMEGVEDIPGTVLSEGIRWDWETFPEYLDALARMPRALDIGAQIPHSAVRTYVMGERGITHDEATPEDIKSMIQVVKEGLAAGALGFSTSRTFIHKYETRKFPPGTFATPDEILGIARAIKEAGHGVFQMTSNHYQMETEFPWLKQIAIDNKLPVAFALVQTDQTRENWKNLLLELDKAHQEGVPIYGAVGARPAGILMAWQGSIHPFMAHDAWKKMVHLPWDEKLQRLRDPQVRRELTDMKALMASAEFDSRLAYLTQSFQKMYSLGANPDYEPPQELSIESISKRDGRSPLEIAYDMLMEQDGKGIIYFPSFNYAYNDLSQLHTQLLHPQTMMSLADGGAHCGYICDVSVPTFLLTHWARDRSRGPKLPLEHIVRKQTMDTANIYGLKDRGQLKPGYLADVNIIDFDKLRLPPPYVAFDLPAGGRRLNQTAEGYVATLKSGKIIMKHGQATGELPGGLIRGPQCHF
ncbi:amidohydrolase [Acidovorax sp. SRB_14]|uniref:N-acyl-D-amino-acid deacylase family protein n=1 Tax=Acidovorax sp. SRB_14 TaxID=1962699 RepID=UPI001567BB3D|nr:amidohydrolase family protein [Acidovorax sp. SRB_14]NMM80448.1 amidohydrolase [Acidovorax sp. SRB_14]